jgi:hypothetical protein
LYREVRYSKFRNHGRFDLKERGKGYCPYMIATVAKHRRDKYNQDAFIRVEKDNLAALSCYKKILLMKSTRLEWINSTEEDGRNEFYIECRPGLNYSFSYLPQKSVIAKVALSRRLRVCGLLR